MSRYIETSAVRRYRGHETISSPQPVDYYDVDLSVDSERLQGQQTIHLGVAEVPYPQAVILVPVSWSDYCKRSFQANRLGTMASFSNARVIGLDFPGMGDVVNQRQSELTETQQEEMLRGRMLGLATQYWYALKQHNLLDDAASHTLPVALWSHSMSTLTVSELAATAPEGVTIQDIVYSESMALRRQSVAGLATQFIFRGGTYLKQYQELNEGAPATHSGLLELARQVIRQPTAHFLGIKALAGGQQTKGLLSAYKEGKLSTDSEHGTRLHIISAEHGLVRPADRKRLQYEVVAGNVACSLLRSQSLAGEAHGYQDGLPCVLDQLSYLAITGSRG